MKTKCVFLLLFIVLLLCLELEGRRSRGRSRGSSGGGGSYSRSKPKYPTQHVDPVALSYGHQKKEHTAPKPPDPIKTQHVPVQQSAPKPSAPVSNPQNLKPSAPVSETVGKQTVGVQNSAPNTQGGQNTNQRPIGWNVDGNKEGAAVASSGNVGWNVGASNQNHAPYPNQNQQTGFGQQHQQASYPNQNQPGFGQHVPHQQASYPAHNQQPGFGQQPHNPAYPNQYQQPGQQYPHYQQPGFGQQYPHYQQHGYGAGYPQQPGGFGGYGGYGGGFGGNTWNPFSGGNHYGGGYGMNNYYQKSSGGFFGKHAFRNILAGLLVWNLVRGFTSTPYQVYHYYHRPDSIPENIPLPANAIVLCDDNATSICTPNTIPLCTKNNTIMCVATISSTSPCGQNTSTPCVNSTIPCTTPDDPLCANKTTENNTTTISIPCLANVTLLGKPDLPLNSSTFNASIQLNGGQTVFCLTTMALPDPSLVNATAAPLIQDCANGNCMVGPQEMCVGNATEGCVPRVVPLSTTTTTTTTTTLFPIMDSTTLLATNTSAR